MIGTVVRTIAVCLLSASALAQSSILVTNPPPAAQAAMTCTHGTYFSDIIRDCRGPDLWLYVVQRHGARDILAMGSCTSEKAARETAITRMREVTGADDASAAAV